MCKSQTSSFFKGAHTLSILHKLLKPTWVWSCPSMKSGLCRYEYYEGEWLQASPSHRTKLGVSAEECYSGRARQFSNWCDVYKGAKVVHGSRSNNHCNWSDILPSTDTTTTRALLLYEQASCSFRLPHLEVEHTHTHTHANIHTYQVLSLSLCASIIYFYENQSSKRTAGTYDWLQNNSGTCWS